MKFIGISNSMHALYISLCINVSIWSIIGTLIRALLNVIRKYGIVSFEGLGMMSNFVYLDKLMVITVFGVLLLVAKYSNGKSGVIIMSIVFPIFAFELSCYFQGYGFAYISYIIAAQSLKLIIVLSTNKPTIMLYDAINIIYQITRTSMLKYQLKEQYDFFLSLHFILFYAMFNIPVSIGFSEIQNVIIKFDKLSEEYSQILLMLPIPVFAYSVKTGQVQHINQEMMNLLSNYEHSDNITLLTVELLDKLGISNGIMQGQLDGTMQSNLYNKEFRIIYKYLPYSELLEVCLIDETHVKQLHELKAKEQLKYMYISSINHHIRTPLYGVSGPLSLISKEISDPSICKLIDIAQISIKHIITVIESTLQFNQFMVEEVKPSLALTDVRKEIEVLKGVYSFEAEEKGITLSFTFKQGNYQCYTDVKLISLLLNILLTNSIKYTFKGHVFLTCKKMPNSKLKITIEDSGIGISDEKIKNIFEEFSDLSEPLEQCKTNNGINLPLCKKIVSVLNGRMKLLSEQNKGTTFKIVIPVEFTEQYEKECKGDTPCESKKYTIMNKYPKSFQLINYQGKRALIVDDNATNIFVLRLMLNKMGIATEKAVNGKECLSLLLEDKEGFDVIFMDLNMPVMDGVEAIMQIRMLEKASKLRAQRIVISTAQNEYIINKTISEDMRVLKVLYKPISIRDLTDCLSGILK